MNMSVGTVTNQMFQLFRFKKHTSSILENSEAMGSLGADDWLDCTWCGKWETNIYLLDCDFVGGVLCPRCYWDGPPHFAYLRGMLHTRFPDKRIDRIATFAYKGCAFHELAASQEHEDVLICPLCNPSWLGWHCQFCSNTISLEAAV